MTSETVSLPRMSSQQSIQLATEQVNQPHDDDYSHKKPRLDAPSDTNHQQPPTLWSQFPRSRRKAAQQAESKFTTSLLDFELPITDDDDDKPRRKKTQTRRQAKSTAFSTKPKQEYQFEYDGKLWEIQSVTCLNNRYSSWRKCVACIAKKTGDTCRFLYIRAFLLDPKTHQVYQPGHKKAHTPPGFVSSFQPDQVLDLPSRNSFNREMDDQVKSHAKQIVAGALLSILRSELQHAKQDKAIRRNRETNCRQMCEHCATSIFSASWFCIKCGREYCLDCKIAMQDAEKSKLPLQFKLLSPQLKRLFSCGRHVLHGSSDLIPLTRFRIEELESEIHAMEECIPAQAQQAEIKQDNQISQIHDNPTNLESNPCQEINWDEIDDLHAGAKADQVVGKLPLREFQNGELTYDKFFHEWSRGEPILVRGVSSCTENVWRPETFIERYGEQKCWIARCDSNENQTKLISVADFFKTFNTTPEERAEMLGQGSWKLKDWPPSSDFKEEFPELYDDFNRAVPAPDFTRRDGVINLGSCYPINVIQPDLGPKMYNAWSSKESPGGQGTTRLHMDMADAVNIMLYANPPKVDNLPQELQAGVAAWDIFRAQDADKIRQFLREEMDPEASFQDDPIHRQKYFIDAPMRVKLWNRYRVRSWRIYQKAGEAVFIPAGCAHQVCNLGDCIKVAVDFISPHNIERCFKLTSEFRELTHDQKAWKEDVLSLRTTLWYAWCSYRQMEGGGTNVQRPIDLESKPAIKMIPQETV